MRNRRGLPCGSDGGCCGNVDVPGGAPADNAAADLVGDIELTACQRRRPRDRITGPANLWSFRLVQSEHPIDERTALSFAGSASLTRRVVKRKRD